MPIYWKVVLRQDIVKKERNNKFMMQQQSFNNLYIFILLAPFLFLFFLFLFSFLISIFFVLFMFLLFAFFPLLGFITTSSRILVISCRSFRTLMSMFLIFGLLFSLDYHRMSILFWKRTWMQSKSR